MKTETLTNIFTGYIINRSWIGYKYLPHMGFRKWSNESLLILDLKDQRLDVEKKASAGNNFQTLETF